MGDDKMLNLIKKELLKEETTNGAIVYSSSMDSVVDFFAKAGALRDTGLDESILLFSKAYAEDRELALKTLFYIRDIRGGQGEREIFRNLFSWLVDVDEPTCIANIHNIAEYGRYDDMLQIAFYCDGSHFTNEVITRVKYQLMLDLNNLAEGKDISLLGKWMWSCNASSKETLTKAHWLRNKLGMTAKHYRKILSKLRKKINIVETMISEKRYEDIDYSTVPSKAMTKYRTAFYRNDETGIENFIQAVKSGKAKINASTLYPYDLVRPILGYHVDGKDRDILEAQWNALPNYIGDREWNGLVVADVSGSMSGLPMEVSVSLALYIAERNNGFFKNHFMTFSEEPSLVEIKGDTFVQRVESLEDADWGYSTNLSSVFDLLLKTAVSNNLNQSEMPEQLFIITDMQFDGNAEVDNTKTFMQTISEEWSNHGYTVPKIVWWNVNAGSYNNSFPMTVDEAGVQYVSGCSPVILKTLLGGQFLSPLDVVKNTVDTPRYERVIVL